MRSDIYIMQTYACVIMLFVQAKQFTKCQNAIYMYTHVMDIFHGGLSNSQ